MTAQEGDIVSFMCSTNLPATFARWEINDEKYPINLPSLFTTSGLNLSFSFVTDTKIRCFFSIYFRESAVDICSNNVTIKALETVSFQSCGKYIAIRLVPLQTLYHFSKQSAVYNGQSLFLTVQYNNIPSFCIYYLQV